MIQIMALIWDTLSDVAVDIQQKFFQIYEAGQEKADETEE